MGAEIVAGVQGVPYTGATQDVDLGQHGITANLFNVARSSDIFDVTDVFDYTQTDSGGGVINQFHVTPFDDTMVSGYYGTEISTGAGGVNPLFITGTPFFQTNGVFGSGIDIFLDDRGGPGTGWIHYDGSSNILTINPIAYFSSNTQFNYPIQDNTGVDSVAPNLRQLVNAKGNIVAKWYGKSPPSTITTESISFPLGICDSGGTSYYIPMGKLAISTDNRQLLASNGTTVMLEWATSGHLNAASLPTSTAGLNAGDLWVDTTGGLNVVKRV
jgi:hypothetical protein